ncbi:MAG: hypothetical protein VX672_06305 [Planctomycetota bacterium]|nr:hypothetical protein [Planctomycetota bacterium]
MSPDGPIIPGTSSDPRGRGPIIGQDAALAELKDALRTGRMPAAWILHGPEGIGKFSTALRFARLLLEPEPTPTAIESFEPPSDSPTARLLDAGTHPDLRVIRKELAATSEIPRLRDSKQRAIPVDLLREHMLGGEVEGRRFDALHARTPFKGVRRVFVIDEAELLNPQGQNALLKTLEEPSPRTVIMLVTTRDERMLPTVRSRCRRVPFRTLDRSSMETWLDGAEVAVDGADRDWLLEFSEGSPGRLLEAIRTGMSSWNATIGPGMARLEQGGWPAGLADTLADLVDEYAKAVVKADKRASKEAANRTGLANLVSVLASRLRTRLGQAARDGDDAVIEACARAVERLADAELRAARNLNLKFVTAGLVADLADAFGVGPAARSSG